MRSAARLKNTLFAFFTAQKYNIACMIKAGAVRLFALSLRELRATGTSVRLLELVPTRSVEIPSICLSRRSPSDWRFGWRSGLIFDLLGTKETVGAIREGD